MADAYGKLTGRPGICFVTRGPGATNASAGVHIACQDSTPVILFIGQVGARHDATARRSRKSTSARMFGRMAKWVGADRRCRRGSRRLVARAFHTATSGRPGPVVLALPEDMLTERVAAAPMRPLSAGPAARPCPEAMAELRERAGAGRSGRSCIARRRRLGRRGAWPISSASPTTCECRSAASFRRQDHFDNTHAGLCRRRRHRPRPAAGRAGAGRPTCCWWSARGSAR